MTSRILSRSLQNTLRCTSRAPSRLSSVRYNSALASKYASKLVERAKQEGTTVDALRERAKVAEKAAAKERLARAAEATAHSASLDGPKATQKARAEGKVPVRQDSSPIKPLASILNLEKILETPHTSEQISALWTAYHASRGGGTGRGVVCASVPRETYETMLAVAARYPQFILPLPRVAPEGEGDQKAYEFFMLQWDAYDAPPPPDVATDIFAGKAGKSGSESPLPRSATAIFTPLGEYKLRQTFAAPHLALTFYPDFAGSHGLVLLRGELTPRTSDPEQFLLSQQDAQLLAMGLQRFYLWGGSNGEEREALLKTFHERPQDFKWEDLVRLGDVLT
ncbi:ATP11-domain-containing protein [Peniophora sp. CONT]|nr:ATP11-domain-containing protein [Peniophora sp. CONT]